MQVTIIQLTQRQEKLNIRGVQQRMSAASGGVQQRMSAAGGGVDVGLGSAAADVGWGWRSGCQDGEVTQWMSGWGVGCGSLP